jgi:hypothetical protein
MVAAPTIRGVAYFREERQCGHFFAFSHQLSQLFLPRDKHREQ